MTKIIQTTAQNTAGLQTDKINGIRTEFSYMCEVMYTLQGTPDQLQIPHLTSKVAKPKSDDPNAFKLF